MCVSHPPSPCSLLCSLCFLNAPFLLCPAQSWFLLFPLLNSLFCPCSILCSLNFLFCGLLFVGVFRTLGSCFALVLGAFLRGFLVGSLCFGFLLVPWLAFRPSLVAKRSKWRVGCVLVWRVLFSKIVCNSHSPEQHKDTNTHIDSHMDISGPDSTKVSTCKLDAPFLSGQQVQSQLLLQKVHLAPSRTARSDTSRSKPPGGLLRKITMMPMWAILMAL